MEVWDYCQGKAYLFYVWLGCYYRGEDTEDFVNMFIRTLGEDNNVEDGFDGTPIEVDHDDEPNAVAQNAHPRRTRKSVSKSSSLLVSSRDNNSSLDKLAKAIAESKKAENNAWTKNNARDKILAEMLVSPSCPEELKGKLLAHFDEILDDATVEKRSN